MLMGALALVAPGTASALTVKTVSDAHCNVRLPASANGGTAHYGVIVERSSCDANVRLVTSLVYLRQRNQNVANSDRRKTGHLDYANEKNHAAAGNGYSSHHDFKLVLGGDARFARHTGPEGCRMETTNHTRDTVSCSREKRLN